MLKRLLFILLTTAAFLPIPLRARDFQYTYEGQTVWYTVLDEDAKTCKTRDGRYYRFNENVTGDLILPEEPQDGTQKYTLKEIGIESFYNCSSLISVSIPNSVTEIGDVAFGRCDSLRYAEFASIEHLCKIKFSSTTCNPLYHAQHLRINGEEITNLAIPNSVTEIGDYAFQGCSSLVSVTIPRSVNNLGDYSFNRCTGLTDFIFTPSSHELTDPGLGSCSNLQNIMLIPNKHLYLSNKKNIHI